MDDGKKFFEYPYCGEVRNTDYRYHFSSHADVIAGYGKRTPKMYGSKVYTQPYGDPGLPDTPESKKYQEENIIEIETVGWNMNFEGIYKLRVHKKLADIFRSLFKHIQFYNKNCNKKEQYVLYGQKGFSYAYSHRYTSGGNISPHSFGIAIDINESVYLL